MEEKQLQAAAEIEPQRVQCTRYIWSCQEEVGTPARGVFCGVFGIGVWKLLNGGGGYLQNLRKRGPISNAGIGCVEQGVVGPYLPFAG